MYISGGIIVIVDSVARKPPRSVCESLELSTCCCVSPAVRYAVFRLVFVMHLSETGFNSAGNIILNWHLIVSLCKWCDTILPELNNTLLY